MTLTKTLSVTDAAISLIESSWEHRCSDQVGGCTAVSSSALEALEEALCAQAREQDCE